MFLIYPPSGLPFPPTSPAFLFETGSYSIRQARVQWCDHASPEPQSPGLSWSSYLSLPSSQDYKHVPPCLPNILFYVETGSHYVSESRLESKIILWLLKLTISAVMEWNDPTIWFKYLIISWFIFIQFFSAHL